MTIAPETMTPEIITPETITPETITPEAIVSPLPQSLAWVDEAQLPGSAELPDSSYRDWETDRKSTRLNSSHSRASRMPSSA